MQCRPFGPPTSTRTFTTALRPWLFDAAPSALTSHLNHRFAAPKTILPLTQGSQSLALGLALNAAPQLQRHRATAECAECTTAGLFITKTPRIGVGFVKNLPALPPRTEGTS